MVKLNRKGIVIMLGLVIVMTQQSAVAEEKSNDKTGLYLGAMKGAATVIVGDEGGSNAWKESEMGDGVYGGYNINRYFGFEGIFMFTITDDSSNRDFFIAQLTATPKFSYPINDRVSVYCKLGLAVLLYTVDYRGGRYDDFEETWSGVVPTSGLGAEFSVVGGLRLRLNYDYTSGDLKNDNGRNRYNYYYNDDYYGSGYSSQLPDSEVKYKSLTASIHYQF